MEQPARLCFVDTETTSLSAEYGVMWDLAIIAREPDGTETERWWTWWPMLNGASPDSLRLNHFYDRMMRAGLRHGQATSDKGTVQLEDIAGEVATLLAGAHIVGACPWFDVNFLAPWLEQWGHVLTAHYHQIDVETLAVGWLAGQYAQYVAHNGPPNAPVFDPKPPWKSDVLYRAIGIDPDAYERHTALGDARMARDIYDLVMGRAAGKVTPDIAEVPEDQQQPGRRNW